MRARAKSQYRRDEKQRIDTLVSISTVCVSLVSPEASAVSKNVRMLFSTLLYRYCTLMIPRRFRYQRRLFGGSLPDRLSLNVRSRRLHCPAALASPLFALHIEVPEVNCHLRWWFNDGDKVQSDIHQTHKSDYRSANV
jgi:hypothetical protein